MARTWAIDKRLAEERERNAQVNPEPRQPAEQHQASGERREAVHKRRQRAQGRRPRSEQAGTGESA